MNVLLCILLKKISVLTAYKFIMTSLLKVYSVMNMKHMLHQSITNGNIMKENMVKNFRKSSQQVCKAENEEKCTATK